MVTIKGKEVQVGDTFEHVHKNVTREEIKAYGKASGDRNGIHMDDKVAELAGLKNVIAHGLLFYGWMTTLLTDLAGDNGRVFSVGGQFRGSVRPGDDVFTTAKVTKIEGNKVHFDIEQYSKTPLKIVKDGQVVKTFEGEERGWVSEKDIASKTLKEEETPEGTLHYRWRLSLPGWAVLEMN
ncbi:MAG: MaoC family dehydratase [Promethearchaeota archaeon]